jgi:mRNA interferase HigB
LRSAGWPKTPRALAGRLRRAQTPKAKVLNRDRVRFEVGGGNYRLIASFDFRRQIVFVKFVGTHAEYDAIDALTVARF